MQVTGRSLLLVAFVVGCGPQVDDELDPEWMLGTFSNVADTHAILGDFKVRLLPDGIGTYVEIDCEGDREGGIQWSEVTQGVILIQPLNGQDTLLGPPESSPFCLEIHAAGVCSENSVVGYRGMLWPIASLPDYRLDAEFYRSDPCAAPPGQAIPCEGTGECDPPPPCSVQWCQAGEPEPCDPA